MPEPDVQLLAGLMRRILSRESEVFVHLDGHDLCIDGYITVTKEEESLIRNIRRMG